MNNQNRDMIPYLWREDHPGMHRVRSFGQTTLEGWQCWGCRWMSTRQFGSQAQAMLEHDRGIHPEIGHLHADYARKETSDGWYCDGCGQKVESKYPEHEKLAKVADQSQSIGEFLEWLVSETEFVIAHYSTASDTSDRLFPAYVDIQKLLAQYFEVDLDLLEKEKRAMLERQRELNDAKQ